MKNYVCIDIGGTEIKFGLVNEQGQIMCKEKMRTEAHQGGREILKKIMNIVIMLKSIFSSEVIQ